MNKYEKKLLKLMLEDYDNSLNDDSGSDGINELLEFVHWARAKVEE